MTVKLSLAKQIAIIDQLIDDAKARGDERMILEGTKVMQSLQNTESKMTARNNDFLHKEKVMVLGQVVVSVISRHLQALPNYHDTIDAISSEIGERLAIELEKS